MLRYFVLMLCVLGALGQGTTRVRQIDINSALDRENIVVLTGVGVYRDELVVLDTYGGVIIVRTDNLTVSGSLFDTFNLSHVYSTVDDATGYLAVCTNKKGRCQYMDVNKLDVLGYVDGLILEGEQGVDVDRGIPLLIANTETNVPSLYTASGNAVTIGQTSETPEYPIRAAQLVGTLAVDAVLLAKAVTDPNFNRKYIAMIRAGGYVYTVSEDGVDIRVTRICESDSLLDNRFHSLYQTVLTTCVTAATLQVLDARLIVLNNGSESEYVIVTYEDQAGIISVCAYTLNSINQAMRNTYETCVVNEIGNIPNEALFRSPATTQCLVYSDPSINTECNLWRIVGESPTLTVFLDANPVAGGTELFSSFSSSTRALVTTTRIQDSGYSYFYLYLVEDNKITKVIY